MSRLDIERESLGIQREGLEIQREGLENQRHNLGNDIIAALEQGRALVNADANHEYYRESSQNINSNSSRENIY